MLNFAVRHIFADKITPVELFEKVRFNDAFLLQSGFLGRYSIVGFDPFLKIEGRDGKTQVFRRQGGKWDLQVLMRDPLEVFQEFFDRFEVDIPAQISSLPFTGGAVGYLSYDYGARMAGISQSVVDDIGLKDLYFVFVDRFFVFDHQEGELWLVAMGGDQEKANERLLSLSHVLNSRLFDSVRATGWPRDEVFLKPKSNLKKKEYLARIEEVKEYLKRGESYEVNFAHRYHGTTPKESWEIYKKLLEINPSPYACYFENEDLQIVSCSPERLVSLRGGILEARPIKGTMPRGKTEKQDKKYEEQLLASVKDEAELNMIVDLARNDLGKVAEIGTVKVTEHRVIEKYSHVQHTMSNIRAVKREESSFIDVVRALFPGGSVTGAPKKRTMEIIDKLEDFRRGAYCGSAGYVSFSGDFDLNILIRTMTCKNGHVYFHSGGAIVIDSRAEEEWKETLAKAAPLNKAVLP